MSATFCSCMYTVYQSLLVFTCLPTFTHVDMSFPTFTRVYLRLPLLTRVYICLTLFTVYTHDKAKGHVWPNTPAVTSQGHVSKSKML